MNKILRGKNFLSKPTIQLVQGVIFPANADVTVVLASNQLNYGEKLASSVTSKAAFEYSLVCNLVQL